MTENPENATTGKKMRRKTATAKPETARTWAVEGSAAIPARRKSARKSAAVQAISPERRHCLIELAAYFIAENQGFVGASSHEHWLQAEREIDASIASGQIAA
ncbi:MAG: DUF2934 domain-containing protein [Betaproteobacteria bacterium]|nr:DUF2934 domain-containing protein [Betaproteobacteria bacterium]